MTCAGDTIVTAVTNIPGLALTLLKSLLHFFQTMTEVVPFLLFLYYILMMSIRSGNE